MQNHPFQCHGLLMQQLAILLLHAPDRSANDILQLRNRAQIELSAGIPDKDAITMDFPGETQDA